MPLDQTVQMQIMPINLWAAFDQAADYNKIGHVVELGGGRVKVMDREGYGVTFSPTNGFKKLACGDYSSPKYQPQGTELTATYFAQCPKDTLDACIAIAERAGRLGSPLEQIA